MLAEQRATRGELRKAKRQAVGQRPAGATIQVQHFHRMQVARKELKPYTNRKV